MRAYSLAGCGDVSNNPDNFMMVDATDERPALRTPEDVIERLSSKTSYQETWTHCSVQASPPISFHQEQVIMGIDEAGRGPVLGPMVYATAFVPISKLGSVKGLGVDDSKKLTEAYREILFSEMNTKHKDWMGWAVTAISPRDISAGMFKRAKYNLNQQAHETTVALVKHVQSMGISIAEMYVDTVGKEATYQEYLQKQLPGINITVSKKADSKYPIVSAASVFAKVTRDYMLKNWKFADEEEISSTFSKDFGSGYPGDPKTKQWLRDCLHPIFGYPSVVRFSWSTCVQRLEKHAVTVIWAGEETEKEKAQKAKAKAKALKEPVRVAEVEDEGSDEEAEDEMALEETSRSAAMGAGLDKKRKADDSNLSDEDTSGRKKRLEVIVKTTKELMVDKTRESFIKAWGLKHVSSLF
ncbi:Ribonuclease H2 subunit A [Dinochytrium kinnereticum]|nr:Ribonuclease H2 subunit A [Dinochytrium kinnereticum]